MVETRGVVGRVFGNLGRLLGGKAGAGLASLAYMVVGARTLGRTDYGVLVLVHTYVIAVAGVIEFPSWHAIVRYGAVAEAQGDRARLARLIVFAAGLELACGVLAIAIAAAFAPLIGPRLGWPPQALAFAVPYSFAVLGTIRATPAGYLQLRGRFDLLGAHNLVAPVVRLAGAGAAVMLHAGLRGFLVAWLAAALAEWITLWALGAWVARGRLPLREGLADPRIVLRENHGLLRFMLGANADVTLSELAGRLSPLAVGWLAGPAAAGLYAVAHRVTMAIAQPAQILGQAAYAEFARVVADGAARAQLGAALLRTIGAGLLAVTPICLVIVFFGKQLAVLLGGAGFAAAGAVMIWLAIARGLQLAASPISAALTALGRPGLSVMANAVSGFFPLLLLPVFIAWLGVAGAGVQALLQAALAVGLLGLGFVQAEEGADRSRRQVHAL
jgi:O-antigen/teichoic acid export membrane protein